MARLPVRPLSLVELLGPSGQGSSMSVSAGALATLRGGYEAAGVETPDDAALQTEVNGLREAVGVVGKPNEYASEDEWRGRRCCWHCGTRCGSCGRWRGVKGAVESVVASDAGSTVDCTAAGGAGSAADDIALGAADGGRAR